MDLNYRLGKVKVRAFSLALCEFRGYNQAASLGPTFQVAVEQWVSREQRIVHDQVAYQILPTPLRAFARIFRMKAVRLSGAICGALGWTPSLSEGCWRSMRGKS